MNIRIILVAVSVLVATCSPFVSHAESRNDLEFISDFHTEITVREDATIHVIETIQYDFATEERHGIIRDIPLTQTAGTFEQMSISNIQVTNEVGEPHPFSVTGDELSLGEKVYLGSALGSDAVSIKIGSANEYVYGKNTYVISYDVKNALGYFDDRTEIYWNATGHDWLVPMKRASVQVNLPGNQVADAILSSYCGVDGEVAPCGDPIMNYNERENTTTIFYDIPEGLEAGEGATIAAGFPKNVVAIPSWQDWFLYYLSSYWSNAIALLVTFFWFRRSLRAWWQRRRFYKSNPIVAEYDAGELDPLQVAGIVNGTLKNEDISAQIIYLATKGYLTINKKDKAYSFHGTNKNLESLSSYNQTFLTAVVGKSTEQLKYVFHKDIEIIKKAVVDDFLTAKRYISPKKRASPGTVAIVALFMVVFIPGPLILVLVGLKVGLAFLGICLNVALISVIFKPRQYTLTAEGLLLDQRLQGLREYIDVAEDERIKFHNAPEKTTELFERLLPYAMVFGLEDKWAKEFADVYTVPPAWYDGVTSDSFSSAAFTRSLSDFTQTATTKYVSSPGSSGSSSSGSSGSGSSGGGGGGGGGRSW